MRFVDDDRVVVLQQGIVVYLGQQDTVGHQLDAGVGRHLVVEAYLVADQPAQLGLQLLRDTRRHRTCRHSARLRMADDTQHTAPQAQAYLGQLRGLPRPRLATHNDDLMLVDGLSNVLTPRHHGQVGRIFNGRELLDTRQTTLGDGGKYGFHGARFYLSQLLHAQKTGDTSLSSATLLGRNLRPKS